MILRIVLLMTLTTTAARSAHQASAEIAAPGAVPPKNKLLPMLRALGLKD
jgi:hypothetical protein